MQVPRDSKMPLEWIQKVCTANPVKKLLDPKTGQFVGNYSTGPVRLAWTKNLLVPQKSDDGKEKYSVAVLWPGGVDLSPLVQAVNECAAINWPENVQNGQFNWAGLLSPWHDQMEKAAQYKGYTPGAFYVTAGTYFKPRIVDLNMNDIVDVDNRLYGGVWAILAVNVYAYGKVRRPGSGPTKKGVSFGLQSTVLIGDDEKFSGGGLDPKAAFTGIKIDNQTNIAAAFGGAITPPVAPLTGGPSPEDQLRALGLL